jgi:N-acyl-D-aspartate/D-glutamate deacylase
MAFYKHRLLALILSIILSSSLISPTLSFAQSSTEYDLIITNGRVLDGSGNPWFRADIGIRNGEIVAVGALDQNNSKEVLDAEGYYVAPGFIDVHTHAASGLVKESLSGAEPLLRQGITTVIINPDGGGNSDIADQQMKLLKHGIGVHVAQLVPHGSLREEVIGMQDREATTEEIERMKSMLREGMEQGAFGISSGPFYAPGSYASTGELIALARLAGEYGGVYTSHIRDESNYSIGLEAAVQEVITVAREGELPGVITHIKALGPPVWGMSKKTVANIDAARRAGVELYADQYPYLASATGLISALVPRWAEEGGHRALVDRLEDPKQLSPIMRAMEENLDRRGGAERIQFRRFEADPSIEGKTLQQVADERGSDAISTAVALIKNGKPGIVSFNMQVSDVHRFMRQSWTMTGSDGGLVPMGEGVPHPRSYAAFPEKISRFVVADSVIDLSFAIRSMTSLPAQVFDIESRGMIRPGMAADLVVFHPEEMKPNASFQSPHQMAEGIRHLLLSGEFVIRNEEFLDPRNGEILRMDK